MRRPRLRIEGRPPLHPLLFAAFPVLFLFSSNVAETAFAEVVPSLLVVVGVVLGAYVMGVLLFHEARRTALALSILVLLTFSYGYARRGLRGSEVFGLGLNQHRFLLVVWTLLAVAATVFAVRLRKERLTGLTKGMNVIALGLVVLNVVSIFAFKVRRPGGLEAASVQAPIPSTRPTPAISPEGRPEVTVTRPDVYYLIMDRYGGNDALKESFGFDNTPFLDDLKERGFVVAEHATSNYPRTLHSLSSALNMQYLDFLTARVGPNSADVQPAISAIRRHAVGRYMKKKGYRYVHLGSWWDGTNKSPIADRNILYGGLSEFSSALFGTTALAPVGTAADENLDTRKREYNRILFQFDRLARTRRMRGEIFVFAHVLSAHEPFVFDSDGSFMTRERQRGLGKPKRYVLQLRFMNELILRLVDHLQQGPEEDRPVIILQGDEGPLVGPGGWEGAPDYIVRRKFPILNAYYLPGVTDPGISQTITPVNSFRTIFNLYFDAGFPELPDRNYVYRNLDHLYEFIDVTDVVRGSPP